MMRRACVVAVMILASSAALSAGAKCDRACLEGFVDRYVDAVVAHDPAQAPLARTAKFTENGQRLHPGDGLWNTASARAFYGLYMADPEGQQVGFFGTIRENDNLAILALRLKVVGGEITEAETLVARTREEAERVEALGAPHPLFSAMSSTPPTGGPASAPSSPWDRSSTSPGESRRAPSSCRQRSEAWRSCSPSSA